MNVGFTCQLHAEGEKKYLTLGTNLSLNAKEAMAEHATAICVLNVYKTWMAGFAHVEVGKYHVKVT